jgi:predicted AlkP superfamily phosphohydrolase/phosphomutase
MPTKKKTLMVAFDAADPLLVEELVAAGRMPNLKTIREAGGQTPLQSTNDWFAAAPWPSFYSSTYPVEHGLYSYLFWDPKEMRLRRGNHDVFPVQPFWRELNRNIQAITVDVPLLLPPIKTNPDQFEVSGLVTHDALTGYWATHPTITSQLKQLTRQPKVLAEKHLPLTVADVTNVDRELRASTESIVDVTEPLLSAVPWEFALISFTAPHMAGHQLWTPTSLYHPKDSRAREQQKQALENAYADCDTALGRLLEHVTSETLVLVFSLGGMEQNTNRGNLLDAMLELILADDATAHGKYGFLAKLRSFIPLNIRQSVKARLPRPVQDWLSSFWRASSVDWSNTKAFSYLPDLQGLVRINLRGRESQGIVEPGDEYEQLCTRIAEGLMEFVDADSKEPIIDEIRRADSFYTSVDQQGTPPDLLINWSKSACAGHRTIVSPFGNIDWPTPGINFDGRSGNHRNLGFVVSNDPMLHEGSTEASILDLAPTVCDYLGVSGPSGMRGKSLYRNVKPQ